MIKNNESKKLELKNRKLKIIQEYLTTNLTQSELRNKYQIGSANFVSTWINGFNIELYQLGYNQEIIDKRKLISDLENNLKLLEILKKNKTILTLLTFTKKERYKIIEEYLTTSMSQSDISRKYKIKWRGNVGKWLYDIENELILKNKRKDYKLNNQEINLFKLIDKHNKNRKQISRFSKTFKETVVEEYKSSLISQRELGKKYNINSRLISDWLYTLNIEKKKLLNLEEESEYIEKAKGSDIMSIEEKEEDLKLESLKLEIARLKEENKKNLESLEYEKFKRRAYSTLIDVAEQELKISIRKKLDVKQ